VDSAIRFEGVTNARKLLGHRHLARLCRLETRRFHLAEWDARLLRKLQTLESIYTKLSDQASNRRLEILEWLSLALIALALRLSFMPGGRPH
jgi:hypothetical protein